MGTGEVAQWLRTLGNSGRVPRLDAYHRHGCASGGHQQHEHIHRQNTHIHKVIKKKDTVMYDIANVSRAQMASNVYQHFMGHQLQTLQSVMLCVQNRSHGDAI